MCGLKVSHRQLSLMCPSCSPGTHKLNEPAGWVKTNFLHFWEYLYDVSPTTPLPHALLDINRSVVTLPPNTRITILGDKLYYFLTALYNCNIQSCTTLWLCCTTVMYSHVLFSDFSVQLYFTVMYYTLIVLCNCNADIIKVIFFFCGQNLAW